MMTVESPILFGQSLMHTDLSRTGCDMTYCMARVVLAKPDVPLIIPG